MLADIPEGYEFLCGVRPEFIEQARAMHNTKEWQLPERIDVGLYSDVVGNFEHYATDLLEDPFNLWFSDSIDVRLAELRRRVEAGLPLENYGVCDSPEQVVERWPFLASDPERYLINFIRVSKHSGQTGGWRWHKWGRYIGRYEPQCEYLDDEPEIESVLLFTIYQFRDPQAINRVGGAAGTKALEAATPSLSQDVELLTRCDDST